MERALALKAKIKVYFKDYRDKLDEDLIALNN
jgi:hypothetical protein